MNKLAGLSGILFALFPLIGLIVITPPFAAMPPVAFEAANVGARLGYLAALPSATHRILNIGFALEIVAGLFLLPPLLGLYAHLKGQREAAARAGLALGALGVPFFLLSHYQRFAFVDLAVKYASANETQRSTLGLLTGVSEGFSLLAESTFWMFFGTAVLLCSWAMLRSTLPRWLAWLGLALGAIAVLGTLGTVININFGFLQFISLIVLVLWTASLGVALVRAKEQA